MLVSAFKTRQCKNPKGHIAMKTQNLKCLPFICASYRIVCQTPLEKLLQIITLIFLEIISISNLIQRKMTYNPHIYHQTENNQKLNFSLQKFENKSKLVVPMLKHHIMRDIQGS
jgi:hypothetical protein